MRPARAQRGFTLVEAIATMAVVTVLGGIGGSLVYSGVQANRDVAVRAQVHEEISTAMEAVCGAIRGIPAKAGPAPDLTSITSTSIQWTGGGQISLSGTTLYMAEVGGTSLEVLRDVQSVAIQCYDAAGAALSTSLVGSSCDAVHRVEVTITAGREGVSDTVRTRVFIRSLQTGMMP